MQRALRIARSSRWPIRSAGGEERICGAIRSGILLVVGQDATADLSLKVGKVNEQVKVWRRPVVNATTQDISGLVGEKEVKPLPLNGRSYDLLLTQSRDRQFHFGEDRRHRSFQFHHGQQFRRFGQSSAAESISAEWREFTGAAENNMQPGGPSGNLLGVEAVREFNVLRDSYGAEYGKRPGAQVNHRHPVGKQPVARLGL